MAIIVNGVTIPTDGDYIVVNGTKVEKVIANDVVVWERKTKPKSAPPFLSAGWRTIFSKTWGISSYDAEDKVTAYYVFNAEDDGTEWIGENVILADFTIYGTGPGSFNQLYIFYLPTVIETNKYSRISAVTEIEVDDDTSEGHAWVESFECSRFSNDGITWTYWTNRKTPDLAYKYAQVGYFFGARSDSSVDLWYYFKMTQFTIN